MIMSLNLFNLVVNPKTFFYCVLLWMIFTYLYLEQWRRKTVLYRSNNAIDIICQCVIILSTTYYNIRFNVTININNGFSYLINFIVLLFYLYYPLCHGLCDFI